MKLQPLNRLRTLLTVLRLRLRGMAPGARFFVHSGLPRIAGRGRIRISFHGYNGSDDMDRAADALIAEWRAAGAS